MPETRQSKIGVTIFSARDRTFRAVAESSGPTSMTMNRLPKSEKQTKQVHAPEPPPSTVSRTPSSCRSDTSMDHGSGARPAVCDYARYQRAELNRINVFPVPDGDTGTNRALTVQAIADHLRPGCYREASAVAYEATHGAAVGARGKVITFPC